jgi:hypothetical protein
VGVSSEETRERATERAEGGDERVTEALSMMVTPRQKAWLERAAKRRQGSVGAVVRTAIEQYRESDPDLGA